MGLLLRGGWKFYCNYRVNLRDFLLLQSLLTVCLDWCRVMILEECLAFIQSLRSRTQPDTLVSPTSSGSFSTTTTFYRKRCRFRPWEEIKCTDLQIFLSGSTISGNVAPRQKSLGFPNGCSLPFWVLQRERGIVCVFLLHGSLFNKKLMSIIACKTRSFPVLECFPRRADRWDCLVGTGRGKATHHSRRKNFAVQKMRIRRPKGLITGMMFAMYIPNML